MFCYQADDTEGLQLSSTDTADPGLSDGLQSLYKPESLEQLLNRNVYIHPEPLLNALMGCWGGFVPLFKWSHFFF